MKADRTGLLAGLLAYSLWGLYPFYFKALHHVSSVEILAHRIVWSLVMLSPLLALVEVRSDLRRVFRTPKLLLGMCVSTLIISSNWLVYVLAVQGGHVLEASLGYFLSPLTFIVLALIVLRERLRPLQWTAVGIAALGVLWMIVHAGVVPKIALFLGVSFSVYGLLRKRLPIAPIPGLFLECLFATPLAAFLYGYTQVHGGIAFLHTGWFTDLLIVLAGFVTVGPLWLFNVAAKRLPLATIGMLQYIAPTLLFVVGAFVFHEPTDAGRLIGFAMIWVALAFYSADALRRTRVAATS